MTPIEGTRAFNKPICSLSSSDKCEWDRMATLRSTGRYQIGGGVALRADLRKSSSFWILLLLVCHQRRRHLPGQPLSRALAVSSASNTWARVTRRRSHVSGPQPASRILIELALVARKSVSFASRRVQNRRKQVCRIAIGPDLRRVDIGWTNFASTQHGDLDWSAICGDHGASLSKLVSDKAVRLQLFFERQRHLNCRPSITETAGKRSRPLTLTAPGVWPFISKTIADAASMRQAISGDRRQQVRVTTGAGGTMVLCRICAMSHSLSRSGCRVLWTSRVYCLGSGPCR
jgi:hypothetical protein